DFFSSAYERGGALAVEALYGLWTLIQRYNVTYPDFWKQLYALVGYTDLWQLPHLPRFFRLLNIFLSSVQLSDRLVAAFVKRTARQALRAPTPVLLFVLPFLYNTLKRHNNVIGLLHDAADAAAAADLTDEAGFPIGFRVAADPFVADEANPEDANAMDSSLWELMALKQHAVPSVAALVRLFEEPLVRPIYVLDEFFGETYASMAATALDKTAAK
ncbi:hypothetical protein CXG81DRAFT_5388, partial [Caulochytrium protostelioides]